MVKLYYLQDDVIVDEKQSYQMKSINEILVHYIDSVIVDMYLGEEPQPTSFQAVHDDFPVPHAGYFG